MRSISRLARQRQFIRFNRIAEFYFDVSDGFPRDRGELSTGRTILRRHANENVKSPVLFLPRRIVRPAFHYRGTNYRREIKGDSLVGTPIIYGNGAGLLTSEGEGKGRTGKR